MSSFVVLKRRNRCVIWSFITIVLIQAAGENWKPVSCFWLTDGISFQPIANSIGLGQVGPKSALDATSTANQEQSKIAPTVSSISTSNNNINIKPVEPLVWLGSTPQQVAELGQQPAEWNTSSGGVGALIPVDPTTTTTTTITTAANQTLARQPVCQCSPDWLQTQAAGHWLSKWLNSASVANQLRSLMSNSTGASGQRRHQHHNQQQQQNHQTQPAKQQPSKHQRHQIGGANGNHLSAWVRAKGNNAVASGARSSAGKGAKWERSPVVETTTAVPATTTSTTSKPTVLYERGPKGERGPRGERGPSDLISVKDRDALFDLAPEWAAPVDSNEHQHQQQQQQQQQQTTSDVATGKRPRLAFVEAEQMLVVDTTTGWRPVQMLPALRDFRKTIAKYSLNRAEDRRRLLTLNADQSLLDNSISDAANLMHRAASLNGRGLNEISADLDDLDDLEDDDDDDEDEEDQNDDDEDEDDADDEIKDEEEEDEEEDQDEDVDDDDDDDELNGTNSVLSPKTVKVAMLASSAKNKATNPKRRRAQMTSRSGATTGQIMDNSISATPLMLSTPSALDLATNKRRPNTATPSTTTPPMKLRLIALNEPFSGNVHGLRGANFECKRHAARANIRGAFRAFLATNYQNVNEIVRPNAGQRYPIVNLRGETLADSWHDLFKSPARMTNPLSRLYSFDGRHVASDSNWPNKLVWHGSANKLGHRDSVHNCDGWHSDSLSKFGYASPLHPPRGSHHNSSANTSRLRHHQRNHKRRFLASEETSATNSTQFNSSPDSTTTTIHPVLDAIDKYPCRMPLIVVCVETIAQSND